MNRDTVLRLGHRRLGFPPPQPPSSSSASSNSTLTPLSSLSLSASNPHGSSPVFSNNMGKKSEPVITKCKESENWTKVTFKPDLAKFNMTHLEDDVVASMKKRVIDLAGCLGKTVKSMMSYVKTLNSCVCSKLVLVTLMWLLECIFRGK
ncbi:DNA topoisomerase 2-like isoform X1 [Camellia sinensis]|uniref:DNA topoisomerase 2-like isoform X1 n=1 Tax=Camellia sinensis TaxID=4442 RepID=UPI0010360E07|nr:DNA topoisomerase 2-like isoform X1 [Camellia sinensis]